jgi:uncharacterized protein
LRVSVTDRLTVASTKPVGNGYLAVRANVARSGVYQYTRGEIGLTDGDPNELVSVYRSPDFTFDEASLATIAHKPVTLNHPPKGVSAKTWKRDGIGHSGGAVSEAEDRKHVVVDMLLMDADGVQAAQTTHKEISLGYLTSIRPEIGTSPEGEPYAAVMDGGYVCDHIALVPAGRAGHTCRVGDAAWPSEEPATPPKKEKPVKTFTLDGLPIRFDDEAAIEAGFKKLQDAANTANARADTADKALTDAQAEAATAATTHATAIQAKDAEIATLTAEKATLTTQLADASSPERLKAAAAAYAHVVDTAKALGATVTDGASEADIKRAVVTAKLGDAAKDWTDAQFDVSFNTLAAGVKVEAKDALRATFDSPTPVADMDNLNDAAAKARQAMIDGLKKPATENAK